MDNMLDWLTELRFYISLDIKQVISEMLFAANLLTSAEKTNIKTRRKITKNMQLNLGYCK